jgi:hypothetical protein
MPQIPMYDGPQVQEKALNYDQANAAQFGGVQARDMTAAGAGVASAANAIDRVAERQTLTEVFDAEAKAKAAYTEWSAKATQEGQGENAKGITQRSQEFWNKTQQDIAKDMGSTQAQRMFANSIMRQAQVSTAAFSEFENKQLDVALAQKVDANNALDAKSAAAIPTPENIKDKTDATRARLAIYGQSKGWGADLLKEKTEEAVSGLNVGVFNNLLANPATYMQAKAFYEKAKGEGTIDSRLFDTMDKRLAETGADYDGGAKGRELAANPKLRGADGVIDMAKADKEAVKLANGDPVLLKAIRQEMTIQHGFQSSAHAQGVAASTNTIVGMSQSGKSLAEIKATPQWSALTPVRKDELEKYILGTKVQLSNADQAIKNNEQAAAYFDLSNPEKIAEMSREQVQALLPKLGQQYTEHLLKMKDSMASAVNKDAARMDTDDFNEIAQQAGLHPFAPHLNEAQKAKLGELKKTFEQAIDIEQHAKKRPLSRDEKLGIAKNTISAKILMPGSLWGTNETTVYNADPAKIAQVGIARVATVDTAGKPAYAEVPISSIPTAQYGAVVKQLRSEGKPTDPTSVASAWYEFKHKKGSN